MTQIHHADDHVSVRTATATYRADQLVLAVPPPPLRRVRFSPSLPLQVQRVIDGLSLGAATKVMSQYPERFWNRDGASGVILTDLGFRLGWDATDGSSSAGGILTTFTTGAAAHALDTRPDRERIAHVHREIDRVYSDGSVPAGGSATKAWSLDRFTGGAYAHYRPGQFADFWPVLRSPHGRLHFAGEHTEALAGYMESAVRSGHRVAARLIRTRV